MRRISATATNDFLGACKHCDTPIRLTDDQRHQRYQTKHVACTDCGQPVKLQRLYATVTSTGCDSACMHALGNQCGCSCGGSNHGKQYAPDIEGEARAEAVGRYRERQAKVRAKREARQAAKREAEAAAHAAWCEDNRELVDWLRANPFWDFCADMVRLLNQGKHLTERQLDCARRMMARDRADRQASADWRAARADLVAWLADHAAGDEFYGKMHEIVADERTLTARQEAAVRRGMDREVKNATVPALDPGRQQVTGQVVAIEEEYQEYGHIRGQMVDKMVLRTAAGQELRVTVTDRTWEALGLDHELTAEQALVGKRVSVKVTVKASRNQPWKGWGSRPSNVAWA